MNLERIVSAVIGGALTAAIGAAVQQGAPPAMPAENCVAVVSNLARIHAATRAEADRLACKYRLAAGEGVARGWAKPTTRRAWDELCLPSEDGEDGP